MIRLPNSSWFYHHILYSPHQSTSVLAAPCSVAAPQSYTSYAMASLVETLTASGGPESAGFLNDLVAHLWPNICVAGGAMIKQIAEPMFAQMLPAPLNTLHFVKIDLGVAPMRFFNVDVHKVENGGIKLDLDVDWDGKCDIEMDGKMIPKVGVEHVKLNGRLSILLCPITNVIPLIGAAQVAFINPPYLKLDYTDGANIANLGFIDSCIRKVVQSIIAGMAVLPNRFLVKLDPFNDYFKTYQLPVGVVRLTVESGANFGEELKSKNIFKKLVHDVPDCYVTTSLSGETPGWKTKTVKDNHHPEWNETRDFIVSDHEQLLQLDVKDSDTASDDDIGLASITIKNLLLSHGQKQDLPLIHKGEETAGKLTVSGKYYQFIPDATSIIGEENPAEIKGLLAVLVAAVKNLKGAREQLKPSVAVTWGAHKFQTVIKSDVPGGAQDIQNPHFDNTFRIPLSGSIEGAGPVRIALLDGKNELGAVEVPLEEVLAAENLALLKEFDVGGGQVIKAGVVIRGTKFVE
ncbi:hypothetical protein QBC40DRAFT_277267 [Triangularia verruculosa]|uniref:Uncharacterized protein n=1 Tax=Triangularia verruculosa TaxID=2587418 RepID=A0AAN6XK06_9PEZI|nr:hypothetical protein QBC40DRAFT_277267 [Triangularia verruculosa]